MDLSSDYGHGLSGDWNQASRPENSQNIRTQANETSGGVEFNFSRSSGSRSRRGSGADSQSLRRSAANRRIYLPRHASVNA